jgi:hypothetical protein
MRGAGHEKYPVWTLVLDKLYPVWTMVLDKLFLYNVKDKNGSTRDIVQKAWEDTGRRIHVFWDVSLDVWFPTFRRNVASSLSGVSSPTTYPTTRHNNPEGLNFHQHRCENLKHHIVNRY